MSPSVCACSFWRKPGRQLNKADSADWQRTSPFAALFYIGKIYQVIAKNAVQSLAPLAAFLVAFQGDPTQKVIFGVGSFAIGTVLLAFLRYWFFRYRITDNSVLIRAGVFRKTQLDIKFERIQAVNTQQNVLFRKLGLLTVSFDTAGSSGREGYLPAVRVEYAQDLRDRIRRVPREGAEEERSGDRGPDASARTLLRLTGGDMVRIGLSSNRVFLLLVLLGPISELVEQEFDRIVEESAIVEFLTGAQTSLLSGIGFGLLLAFGILVVLFAISIAGAFLRFYRYELIADDDVFRSTGGLLTRHEHSVNGAKVQSLQASQHVVLRIFRRFRLRARQASSGRGGRSADFIVPICTGEELATLAGEFYRQEFSGLTLDPQSAAFAGISGHYVRSRIGLFGLLPATLGTAALWPAAGAAALVILLWIPACSFLVWQTYRRFGLLHGKDGIAFRSGLIGYRVVAWLHRKVQRVDVTQSPFQRRKELATVRIFLAAGAAIKIPYIEHAKAKALRDYVLYRVESSREAWH
jgi:putative membrane protein